MDIGQPSVVTVACRFVPFDQWLLTHVSRHWKVKQVKQWILAKCSSHPRKPIYISIPSQSKSRNRTTSPITFAHTTHKLKPKTRGLSPITFAPTTGINHPLNREISDSSSEQEVGEGYEEDDEEDSDDIRSQRGRDQQHPPNRPQFRDQAEGSFPQNEIPIHYAPERLTVIRFATGQILDDDQTFDEYDIHPYELLEIHRAGVVLRLPRNLTSDYIQPYWEGCVQSLRQVYQEPRTARVDDGTSKRQKEKAQDRRPGDHYSRRNWRLEWRKRWLVVQGGRVTLYKDKDERVQSQSVLLSSVCSLKGSDYLVKTTNAVTSSSRIVCAKFTQSFSSPPDPPRIHDESRRQFVYGSPEHPTLSRELKLKGKMKSRLNEVSTVDEITASTFLEVNSAVLIPSSSSTITTSTITSGSPKGILRSGGLHEQPSAMSLHPSTSAGSIHIQDRNDPLALKKKVQANPTKRSKNRKRSTRTSSPLHEDECDEYDQESSGDDVDEVVMSPLRTASYGHARTTSASIQMVPPSPTFPVALYSDVEGPENLLKNPYEPHPIDSVPASSAESSAFSSPVFAHSKLDSDDESDDFMLPRQRVGYGYYGSGNARSLDKGSEDRSRGRSVTSDAAASRMKGSTGETEDFVYISKQNVPSEVTSGGHTKPSNEVRKRKPRSTGEWIVLDLLDDNAYTSLLRILHRHCPHPISSSFIEALPSLNHPSPTTETRTGTIENIASSSLNVPTSLEKQPMSVAKSPSDALTSSLANSSSPASTSSAQLNRLPTFLTVGDGVFPPVGPSPKAQHPASLHISTKLSSTLGAVPYPEWRRKVTERALRAGIGEIGRPIEYAMLGTTLEDMSDWPSINPSFQHKHKDGRDESKRPLEPGQFGMSTEARRERQRSRGNSSIIDQLPLLDSVDSESDTGGSSSEAEWLGWMGDLHRQGRAAEEQRQKLEQLAQEPVDDSVSFAQTDDYPINRTEDYRHFLDERLALEPTGIVTSLSAVPSLIEGDSSFTYPFENFDLNTPSPTPVSMSVLSSPSSMESFNQHERLGISNFGLSHIDTAFSAMLSHSRSGSSQNKLPFLISDEDHLARRDHSYPRLSTRNEIDPTLGHRRPSMPSLSTSSTPYSSSGPLTSIPSDSPSLFPFRPSGGPRYTTTVTVAQTPNVIRRISVNSPTTVASRSRNRSDVVRPADKSQKRSGKDRAIDERDIGSPARKEASLGRPRLLSSTSQQSLHHTNSSISMEGGSNDASSSRSTSKWDRRKSGSGTLSSAAVTWDSPEVGEGSEGKKKKKSLVRGVSTRAEKFVRGLDGVLDFVDSGK